MEQKYVEKLENKKGYKLGRVAYRLAGNRDYQNELKELAKPEMEWVTETLNENSPVTALINVFAEFVLILFWKDYLLFLIIRTQNSR